MPNFKTKALAVRLKGKENCENEHRETANFMYTVVQKSMELQCIQKFLPQTLFDLKELISGPIELKFSGKTLNAIL